MIDIRKFHSNLLKVDNLLITKIALYCRFYLNFMAVRICQECAPHEIRTLFTMGWHVRRLMLYLFGY